MNRQSNIGLQWKLISVTCTGSRLNSNLISHLRLRQLYRSSIVIAHVCDNCSIPLYMAVHSTFGSSQKQSDCILGFANSWRPNWNACDPCIRHGLSKSLPWPHAFELLHYLDIFQCYILSLVSILISGKDSFEET
jgi:hypothetical protein